MCSICRLSKPLLLSREKWLFATAAIIRADDRPLGAGHPEGVDHSMVRRRPSHGRVGGPVAPTARLDGWDGLVRAVRVEAMISSTSRQ